jgi:hypothetical protein
VGSRSFFGHLGGSGCDFCYLWEPLESFWEALGVIWEPLSGPWLFFGGLLPENVKL